MGGYWKEGVEGSAYYASRSFKRFRDELVVYQERDNRKKTLKEEYNTLVRGEAYLRCRLLWRGCLFEEYAIPKPERVLALAAFFSVS